MAGSMGATRRPKEARRSPVRPRRPAHDALFEEGCGVDDRTDSLLRREAADEEEPLRWTLPRTGVRADEIVLDVDPIGGEPAFSQLAGGEIRQGDERIDIPPPGPTRWEATRAATGRVLSLDPR